MVICGRRMGIRARAARVREGRVGIQSQMPRDEPWHNLSEVRCGAGESRCLAAAPATTESCSGNGDVLKGFHHGSSSGQGSLVTPPSPRGLSADSRWPRQRRRRTSSSRARGRSAARGGGDDVDCGAESKCSTTSTQQPSIGRPYTPSLPDDASDADVDSLRKNLMDSGVHSKDMEGVHRVPVGSTLDPLTDYGFDGELDHEGGYECGRRCEVSPTI
jgi:hypothetical protein